MNVSKVDECTVIGAVELRTLSFLSSASLKQTKAVNVSNVDTILKLELNCRAVKKRRRKVLETKTVHLIQKNNDSISSYWMGFYMK